MRCWRYHLPDGILVDPDGVIRSKTGYSGAPGYVNDVKSVALRAKGPIPPGYWMFNPAPWSTKGPQVLALLPEDGTQTQTYGRTAFMIHGDNKRRNRSASNGCIILDRFTRDMMRNSDCWRLYVDVRPWVTV